MRKHLYVDTASEPGSSTGGGLLRNKLSISYNEQQETLLIKLAGSVSSKEIRNGYDMMMEKVSAHKPRKCLLDLQEQDKVEREDQRWMLQQVFPAILRVVGKDVFVAVILPVALYPGIVKELEGDELMCDGNFLILDHFLYPEEAQRWLNAIHLAAVGPEGNL